MKTYRCLVAILFCSLLIEGTYAVAQERADDNQTVALISYTGSWPEKCRAVINWTTDREPACSGFNIYRSTSLQTLPGSKVNTDLIQAFGTSALGGSYTFTDKGLLPNKTYFYLVEAVGTDNTRVVSPPFAVKTKRLLDRAGGPSGSYPAMREARDALQSDATVEVQKVSVPSWRGDVYYIFTPKNSAASKGFIFYPGGKVKPESYAPLLREIAAEGYLCVLVQMPGDLALFGYDRAAQVIKDRADITSWIIGGHSLGGVMACRYIKDFGGIKGVILLASYPSSSFSIAETKIKAISLYGTRDGLVTSDEIQESVADLPPETQFVPIIGGNHTQMGWYDTAPYPVQYGDNPALISREEQQQMVCTALRNFFATF